MGISKKSIVVLMLAVAAVTGAVLSINAHGQVAKGCPPHVVCAQQVETCVWPHRCIK
jgi:hypothetical protein